jgi:hypothetical protein
MRPAFTRSRLWLILILICTGDWANKVAVFSEMVVCKRHIPYRGVAMWHLAKRVLVISWKFWCVRSTTAFWFCAPVNDNPARCDFSITQNIPKSSINNAYHFRHKVTAVHINLGRLSLTPWHRTHGCVHYFFQVFVTETIFKRCFLLCRG